MSLFSLKKIHRCFLNSELSFCPYVCLSGFLMFCIFRATIDNEFNIYFSLRIIKLLPKYFRSRCEIEEQNYRCGPSKNYGRKARMRFLQINGRPQDWSSPYSGRSRNFSTL